jgi:hypothetical protein
MRYTGAKVNTDGDFPWCMIKRLRPLPASETLELLAINFTDKENSLGIYSEHWRADTGWMCA